MAWSVVIHIRVCITALPITATAPCTFQRLSVRPIGRLTLHTYAGTARYRKEIREFHRAQ